MNKIPHHVTRVIEGPKAKEIRFTPSSGGGEVVVTVWNVVVEANSYGRIGEHTLTFDTEEEANEVQKGYTYDA